MYWIEVKYPQGHKTDLARLTAHLFCVTDKSVGYFLILAAAVILLQQTGYASMTMQAAATAAGLAKGTRYLWLTSRESLVLAVHDQ